MQDKYQLIARCAKGLTVLKNLSEGMTITVGRSSDSDIVLPSDRTLYSRTHAKIECCGGNVIVCHLGKVSPTRVNDIPVQAGGTLFRPGDRITIVDNVIEMRVLPSEDSLELPTFVPSPSRREPILDLPPRVEPVAEARPCKVRVNETASNQKVKGGYPWEYPMSRLNHAELYTCHLFEDASIRMLKEVHLSIINELLEKGMLSGKTGENLLKSVQTDDEAARKLKSSVAELIDDHVERIADKLPYGVEKDGTEWKITPEQFRKALHDDIFEKLGALTPLLETEEITEIMINRYDDVFIEAGGLLYHTPFRYSDENQLRMVIDLIASFVNRQVNNKSPMLDARLPDGSRVNAVIVPLSLNGSSMTIRKFPQKRLQVDDLVKMDTMSKEEAAFLKACVHARKNILVSGGTGSGKTTLLNVLSSFISERERIVTIEDSAELKLDQRNLVRLETRPENAEKEGKISIQDLVINALRMRPDRIIVGECRGKEALDMLQAMNTGHDGSLTTCHANSAKDAMMRLENMVLMAGNGLPDQAIKDQIASALDLIVQLSRMPDGTRKVTEIIEITRREEDMILHTPLFKYDYENHRHQATGLRPSFVTMNTEEGKNGIVLGDESMGKLVEFREGKPVVINPLVFQVS